MAQVQTKTGGGIVNASKQITIAITTQNCTAGNTLILAAADDYGDGVGQQIVSISDGNNTWNRHTGNAAANTDTEVWYAYNIVGGIKPTLTITYANLLINTALCLAEYSGLTTADPKDKAASASDSTGTSTAPASGNTAVLSQAAETIIGVTGWNSATATVSNPVTGYGNLFQVNNQTLVNCAMADKVVSATTAQSVGYTLSAGAEWVCICTTFKNTTAGTSINDWPIRTDRRFSNWRFT